MGGESLIEGVLAWGFLLVSLLAIALVTFARGRSLIRKAQALAPLWHTVEELKAQIEAKAKELEAMLGEWAKAKQDIALADEARKFLQEYAGEIAQKEAQLATLKERIEESRRRFDEETEKLQKTQDDLNARTEELNKVRPHRGVEQGHGGPLRRPKQPRHFATADGGAGGPAQIPPRRGRGLGGQAGAVGGEGGQA